MKQKNLVQKKKIQKNQTDFNSLLTLFIFWIIPAVWIATIPRNKTPWQEEKFAKNMLKNGEFIINKFQNDFGYAPQTLSQIRVYALFLKKKFIPWDSYGQKFEYFNFDNNQWYLRSFGKDGRQNTLMTPQDLLVSKLNESKSEGVKHSYYNQSSRYNPIILNGSYSFQDQWFAKLYQDYVSGSSKLVVRHSKKKDYFLIAQHDAIEEFYWLPDGYRIVYSASGSNRYKDGIYLWNLLNDETVQIFPEQPNLASSTFSSNNKFWNMTLAGITKQSPPKLMAFAAPRNNVELNFANFFTPENFQVIELPIKGKSTIISSADSAALYDKNLLTKWRPNFSITNCQSTEKTIEEWCHLSTVDNNINDSIEKWQEYAEKSAKKPHFSYVLLEISLLYQQLIYEIQSQAVPEHLLEPTQNKLEIIRSYALEISSALSNIPVSPSWIRSVALEINRNLTEINEFKIKALELEKTVEKNHEDLSPPEKE